MKTTKYKITIITKTGLHIGSGRDQVEIGGLDQAVIKDIDGFPYIPASSLKGKLRSIYEIINFSDELDNKIGLKTFDGINFDEVSMFFGKAGDIKDNTDELGPTRFIFRDMKLKEQLNEDEKKLGYYGQEELMKIRESGEPIYEEKMEVMIDRFTGTVSKSGPRPLERVPASTVFEGDLIVRFFDKEKIIEQWQSRNDEIKSEEDIMNHVFGENFQKLKEMLENDYLGGQGSRGSGQITITFSPHKENKNDETK